MAGPGAVEFGRVAGIAGARDDQQLRIGLAQFGDEARGQHRLVHGQHHGERAFDAQLVERIAARGIAESRAEAAALGAGDQVGVRIDRDIGFVVRFQHPRDQATDAARSDDDDARVAFILRRQFRHGFDPPGDRAPDQSEDRRDGQADGRDDLPELGRPGLDQQRGTGRREHDQRGFGRARHQDARLRRCRSPCAHQTQKDAGDQRLEDQNADHGGRD